MNIEERIARVRAHVEKNGDRERATFSLDGIRALLEAIDARPTPAAAEPVASMTRYLYGQYEQANLNLKSIEALKLPHGAYNLYVAPHAPSVAMKALEWATDENHLHLQRADFYTIESEFRQGFALHTAGRMGVQWFSAENEAKAAAQADYEARIRSALSAQVQDVSEIIETVEECVLFSTPGEYAGLADHAAFEAGQDNAIKTVVKLLKDMLAAAPAKQEG